jgi:tRNA dimethylallyltransferase
LLAIVGPTAVGKTALAVRCATLLGGEIVSADSMQVYRGMDIGTAKPTPEERRAARFHLVDIVDPATPYSVAEFQIAARAAIVDIHGRGCVPILVGGSGLYVSAVLRPLDFPIAGADPDLRAALSREAAEQGPEALHRSLAAVDPASAARLHPRDEKRVIRALEVFRLTGRPLSAFHQEQQAADSPYDALVFGLTMPREGLYRRIEERIDQQLAAGLLAEVQGLLARGFTDDLPAMKGLGYRQLAPCVRGEATLEEATALFKRDTRRFAKRQYTWFRRMAEVVWLDLEETGGEAGAAERITIAWREQRAATPSNG